MPSIGNGIIIPGDNYPRLSSFTTPLMTPPGANILAAYFLGGIAKKGVLHNYADPTKPLTMRGNPAIFKNFARCDVNNCFDTGQLFPETAVRTIAIVKLPSDATTNVTRGVVFSDYDVNQSSTTAKGMYLDATRDGTDIVSNWYFPAASNGTGVVTKRIAQPNLDDFQMVSCGHFPKQQSYTSMYNFNTEKNDGGAASAAGVNPYTPTGRTMLIGGHHGGSNGPFQGTIDIMGFMIVSWGTSLDDAMSWLYKTQGPQLGMW